VALFKEAVRKYEIARPQHRNLPRARINLAVSELMLARKLALTRGISPANDPSSPEFEPARFKKPLITPVASVGSLPGASRRTKQQNHTGIGESVDKGIEEFYKPQNPENYAIDPCRTAGKSPSGQIG